MKGDERKKSKLIDVEENELQRSFLSAPDLHIEDGEIKDILVAANNPELDDSLQPSSVQMAAALVEQAMQGRWMPLEVVYHKDFERAKQAFLLYHKLYTARAICLLILVVLPFFEVIGNGYITIPLWCQGKLPDPCGDPKKYALSGIPYIERWISLLIETLCLFMLVCSLTLQWYYMGPSFWKRKAALSKFELHCDFIYGLAEDYWLEVALLAAITVTAAASAAGILEAVQLSMYLRVLVPMIFTRALRVCFRMTIRIVHTFADIAVLLGLFVLLSAYLANLIFRHAVSEFEDFRTALLNLLVLLTTANNPNVWAAAYTADRRAFFFFFTYLVIGLFFLMNLVFTVIYSNYKAQIANEVEKRITVLQQSLRAAFTLLDPRRQEWIDGATMMALFHAMSIYSHIPDFHTTTRKVFSALDKRGDFKICQDEFEGLCDVIASEVEHQPRTLQRPSSRAAQMLAVFDQFKNVTEPIYDLFIWAIILASVLVAICERETKSKQRRNQFAFFEALFVWVFVLDALVKISIHGWKYYWRKHLNQFDFLLTVSTTIVLIASFLHLIEHHWVSILFIARGLRVFSFIVLLPRWHLMSQTLLHLIPATAPVLALQFLVCTLFSLLGVNIFGGEVYLGNPLLEDTDYGIGRLYAFNYNDFASAMATSFNLCIVNNWYVIMDAYAVVSGTVWSRSFFISFWAIAVAFTLNVVVAFFVEAFVIQVEKAEVQRKEDTIPSRSETSVLGRRTGRKLQRYSWYDLYEDFVKK